jgi:hypothetical protein
MRPAWRSRAPFGGDGQVDEACPERFHGEVVRCCRAKTSSRDGFQRRAVLGYGDEDLGVDGHDTNLADAAGKLTGQVAGEPGWPRRVVAGSA